LNDPVTDTLTDPALAALVAALLAGLGGLLVPRLVARVPEPAPKQVAEDAPPTDEPPKMLYADIAAQPGLAWRSALLSAAAGALRGAAAGLDWPLLWLVPLTPVAVALSVIDWHTRLLPRVVVVPATLAAIVVVTVVGLATGEREALVRALVVHLERSQILIDHDLAHRRRQEGVLPIDGDARVDARHVREATRVVGLVDPALAGQSLREHLEIGRDIEAQIGEGIGALRLRGQDGQVER